MTNVLPRFKGYTADFRLQEFRKANYPHTLEFIPFTSPLGARLLREMQASHAIDCKVVTK